jgi:outer membrane protein
MQKSVMLHILLYSGCLFAQSNPRSIGECVRIALANNPGLRMAENDLRIANEDVSQAQAARWAFVDFSGTYKQQSMVPEFQISKVSMLFAGQELTLFPGSKMKLGLLSSYDFRINATQPLFTGFRIRNGIKAAEAGANSKSYELRRNQSELIFKVESAYGNVLKAQKFVQIANAGKEQVLNHLRDVENYVSQGMARKDELLRVKVKLAEAELTVIQAQSGLDMALAALENVMGEKINSRTSFEDLKPGDSLRVDVEESYRKAISERAELQSLIFAKEASKRAEKIARGDWLPSLAIFGNYGYGRPGLNFIQTKWMDYWIVGAGMEWNLWNWGKSRSKVQQAVLKTSNIQEAEKQVRLAIRLDVTQACLKIDEAIKKEKSSTELEVQAQETFQVVENSYKQGQVTNSEFLDSQLDLTRAQLLRAQAEIDHALAKANWYRAVGINLKNYQ